MTYFRAISSVARTTLFSDCRVTDGFGLASAGATLFVSNHVASSDTWLLMGLIESLSSRRVSTIASSRVLALAPFARGSLIPVSDNPFEVLAASKRVNQALSDGSHVLLFPEGTHHASFESPGPFLPGTRHFLRAAPKGTKCVPIAMSYFVYRKPRPSVSIFISGDAYGCDDILKSADPVARLRDLLVTAVDRGYSEAAGTYRETIKYPLQDWWLSRESRNRQRRGH